VHALPRPSRSVASALIIRSVVVCSHQLKDMTYCNKCTQPDTTIKIVSGVDFPY